MRCREKCGACCIAPSINQPFLGMPEGKPAGVHCVHLDGEMRCMIFDKHERPKVCAEFQPELSFCGETKEEAIAIINSIEILTS